MFWACHINYRVKGYKIKIEIINFAFVSSLSAVVKFSFSFCMDAIAESVNNNNKIFIYTYTQY